MEARTQVSARIDPDLKRALDVTMAAKGTTFQEWLTEQARRYVRENRRAARQAIEAVPVAKPKAAKASAKKKQPRKIERRRPFEKMPNNLTREEEAAWNRRRQTWDDSEGED